MAMFSLIFSLTAVFDFFQFVGAQGVEMGEIEAQLVGADARSGLLDVQSQHLAQGGVQHVGGGMVNGDVAAPRRGPLPARR